MQDPLITTIIPTYQRPILLRKAIASVLKQTYPHFQVLVLDNASQDETATVVRELSEKDVRVKYHCHAENIGMMANYQFGLSQVKTPLFSFLSDDDVLLPCFFENALEGFHAYPDAAFFAGSTIIKNEAGKVIRIPLDSWSREGYFGLEEALPEMVGNYPVPTTVLFHKKVIGTIPIDVDNTLVWDCDFLLQTAARFPIFITKKPCGVFLHHAASYSYSQEASTWITAYSKLMEKMKAMCDLSPSVKDTIMRILENEQKGLTLNSIHVSLSAKKFGESRLLARFYYDRYGSNRKARVLLLVTKICAALPPALPLILLAWKIKKSLKKLITSDA